MMTPNAQADLSQHAPRSGTPGITAVALGLLILGAPTATSQAAHTQLHPASAQAAATEVVSSASIPTTVEAALASAPVSAEVREALAVFELARAEAVAAGYRGDVQFSARPSWETSWIWDEQDDPYHELSTTLETTIPTGLNTAERTRLKQALSRTAAAEAELREAILRSVESLFAAYTEAYLSRLELTILEDELSAIRLQLDAKEARYLRGETSLLELLALRDELRSAEQALETRVMNAELAILDLALKSGAELPRPAEPGALLETTPQPASPTTFAAELSLPEHERVLSRIDHSHPRVALQTAMLEIAEQSSRPTGEPLLSSVGIGYSGEDGHGAAVSYSFRAPSLSLSYSPPRFSEGPAPGVSDSRRERSDETTISLSAVFSLSVGRDRKYEQDTGSAAAVYELRRLEALQRALVSEITAHRRAIASAESQHRSAMQAVEQAERSYAAAAARETLGTADPGEVETAAAFLARTRFTEAQRKISVTTARLRYIAAAHLPQALPEELRATLFETADGGAR